MRVADAQSTPDIISLGTGQGFQQDHSVQEPSTAILEARPTSGSCHACQKEVCEDFEATTSNVRTWVSVGTARVGFGASHMTCDWFAIEEPKSQAEQAHLSSAVSCHYGETTWPLEFDPQQMIVSSDLMPQK
jgi:hypothetical protein